jgi:hypothetical protein
MRPLVGCIAILGLTCLLPRLAHAQPSWAKGPDQADKSGHTFICEGQGKDEETALSTAAGACNDKICKVCGVEVESVLKTKETLTGVSMERQVVERCRRVRKADPLVKFKNVDCGPTGCRAWIQVFYSKADEEAECPKYASEKFADPARCETDVDDFLSVQGRSALAFKQRRDAMDRALMDCKDIDVRPTPALTAIEAKLHKGLDNFETSDVATDRRALADWAYFTHAETGWRDDLRMTKTLGARLQKIRNVVHDRFVVFTVLEASQAKDVDSPAGIQRLVAAMKQCPPGARFGALDDVNLHALEILYFNRVPKTDTTAVSDFIRKTYAPDSLARLGYVETVSTDNVLRVVAFFASDGLVTPEEWDYALRIPDIAQCRGCLPLLVHAPRHGGDAIKLKRMQVAHDRLVKDGARWSRNFASELVPTFDDKDPEFLLRVEPSLPESMRPWYDAYTFHKAASAAQRLHVDAGLQARIDARYLRSFESAPVTEDRATYCQRIRERADDLAKRGLTGLDPIYKGMCGCVADPTFKNEGLRLLLLQHAMEHGVSCRCPIDAKKTRVKVTFGWKKGETPRNYGPYAERKVTLTIDVDPAWHACVAKYRDRDSNLRFSFYGGATEGEVMNARRTILEDAFKLSAPHDTVEFEGRFLCDKSPAFVGYELRGKDDLAVLNGKRVVLPIHCE